MHRVKRIYSIEVVARENAYTMKSYRYDSECFQIFIFKLAIKVSALALIPKVEFYTVQSFNDIAEKKIIYSVFVEHLN